MYKLIQAGLLGAVVLSMAACGSKGGTKPEDQTAAGTAAGAAQGADSSGLNNGLGPDGRPLGSDSQAGGIPAERVVHFAYDRSDIRDGDRATLDAHAKYLGANQGSKVRLEGHADERGSREYNMALGERRAQSAQRYLGILGVSADQVSTHSYGEESPVAAGHDESSWQQNRRVEIMYSGDK